MEYPSLPMFSNDFFLSVPKKGNGAYLFLLNILGNINKCGKDISSINKITFIGKSRLHTHKPFQVHSLPQLKSEEKSLCKQLITCEKFKPRLN